MAERQMGDFLKEMPKNIGGNPKLTPRREEGVEPKKLQEVGITYQQSSRAQKLAAIPEPEFHERIAVATASGGKLSTAKVVNTYLKRTNAGDRP